MTVHFDKKGRGRRGGGGGKPPDGLLYVKPLKMELIRTNHGGESLSGSGGSGGSGGVSGSEGSGGGGGSGGSGSLGGGLGGGSENVPTAFTGIQMEAGRRSTPNPTPKKPKFLHPASCTQNPEALKET
jgi:hypothetical protein